MAYISRRRNQGQIYLIRNTEVTRFCLCDCTDPPPTVESGDADAVRLIRVQQDSELGADVNYVPFLACACAPSEPRRDLRLCAGAILMRPASLHIELHAVEIGYVEVDELTGDVTVVCPERLACRHMGDDFALYNAFLVALR